MLPLMKPESDFLPWLNRRQVTNMRSHFQFQTATLLIATAIIACLMAGLVYLRKPISDAKRIRVGYSLEQVHEVLGAPTTVFKTNSALRASKLNPRLYTFSAARDSIGDLPASRLPAFKCHAEWFQYTSTQGHLVYYDENGVELVYWGRL